MTRAGGDDPTRTVVQFTGGVHVPAWLAVLVGLALLFSALGFLLSLFMLNDSMADRRRVERELGTLRELRLQIGFQKQQLDKVEARQEMLRLDFHDVETGLVNRGFVEPEDLNHEQR